MGIQYTNLAYIHAKTGKTEALGKALQELTGPSRADPACLVYELHRSVDDPDLWFLYEIWRSKEAQKAHLGLPFMKNFLMTSKDLVEGNLEMRGFQPVSTRFDTSPSGRVAAV